MSHSRVGQSPHGTSTAKPSERVVQAVADAEGVDPVALDVPLFQVVDPDALDSLFEVPGTSGHICFTYCGYQVTVTADGEVDLDG